MGLVKSIPPRLRRCSRGQEEFLPGSHYYSELEDLGNKGYVRKDYCVHCWCEQHRPSPNQQERVFWKSKVSSKQKISEDPTMAEDFLKLLNEIGQKDSEEAFLLALFLQRKKILVLKSEMQGEDGVLFLLFEVAETEEVIAVKKVEYELIQVERVIKSLETKLKCG